MVVGDVGELRTVVLGDDELVVWISLVSGCLFSSFLVIVIGDMSSRRDGDC